METTLHQETMAILMRFYDVTETIEHWIKTGFGMDSDCTATVRFAEL